MVIQNYELACLTKLGSWPCGVRRNDAIGQLCYGVQWNYGQFLQFRFAQFQIKVSQIPESLLVFISKCPLRVQISPRGWALQIELLKAGRRGAVRERPPRRRGPPTPGKRNTTKVEETTNNKKKKEKHKIIDILRNNTTDFEKATTAATPSRSARSSS